MSLVWALLILSCFFHCPRSDGRISSEASAVHFSLPPSAISNSTLPKSSPTKIYALYFPQFHRDALNDGLWGAGFTDWDSLRAAPPANKFDQELLRPSLWPLGYYDLLNISIRRQQRLLATKYGIDGFLYHHYWFHQQAMAPPLSAPLERMLLDGEPDIKFAFNWAKQDWTSTWHGKGKSSEELLVQQRCPKPNNPLIQEHYRYLRRFFQHKNYIRVPTIWPGGRSDKRTRQQFQRRHQQQEQQQGRQGQQQKQQQEVEDNNDRRTQQLRSKSDAQESSPTPEPMMPADPRGRSRRRRRLQWKAPKYNDVPLLSVYDQRYLSKACAEMLRKYRQLAMADGFPYPGIHIISTRLHMAQHFLYNRSAPFSSSSVSNGANYFREQSFLDGSFFYPFPTVPSTQLSMPEQCIAGQRGKEDKPTYLSLVIEFDNTPRRKLENATVWRRSSNSGGGQTATTTTLPTPNTTTTTTTATTVSTSTDTSQLERRNYEYSRVRMKTGSTPLPVAAERFVVQEADVEDALSVAPRDGIFPSPSHQLYNNQQQREQQRKKTSDGDRTGTKWEERKKEKERSKSSVCLAPGKSLEYDLVHLMMYEMCCQNPAARAQGGQFVVLNAWNEWGEGMALEPSAQLGITYLEAVLSAKTITRRMVNFEQNVGGRAHNIGRFGQVGIQCDWDAFLIYRREMIHGAMAPTTT